MPEYTIAAVVAAVAVGFIDLRVLRTRLLASRAYWLSMAIVFFFQILVDGWLTKLSAPIVRYERSEFSGIRFPWDIPIEDFAFGFAMVTLTMVLWDRYAMRRTLDRDG